MVITGPFIECAALEAPQSFKWSLAMPTEAGLKGIQEEEVERARSLSRYTARSYSATTSETTSTRNGLLLAPPIGGFC